MAASDVPVFEVNPNPPPRPCAVASWLGMAPEEITAGLADGTIVPPPGASYGGVVPRRGQRRVTPLQRMFNEPGKTLPPIPPAVYAERLAARPATETV